MKAILELVDNFSAEKLAEALLTVKKILFKFAVNEDFWLEFSLAFGNNFDPESAEKLRHNWVNQNFEELPEIEIRSSEEINGANGAFSVETNTIYLAQEYITHNAQNSQAIATVLLEEFGHFLDSQLNKSDAPGDEGAIFSALALGEALGEEQLLQLKTEDDLATITLDEQVIQIEQATVSDSGGFEGSEKTITLDSNGGGVAKFRYQHFTIPDNFIIRYEGKNLLETGFVGGTKTGEIQIPKGNSNQLDVIVATNDEGTAWNYDVTTDDCASTTPFLIELANGEFEDTDDDGDCEGSGTVFLGYDGGIARMLRIDSADVEFDDKELRVSEGTVFSLIGNIPEPLFTGNFVLNLKSGTTSALTDIKEPNQFQLGDLVDIDFKSLTIKRNKIALTGDFTLPLDLGEVAIQLDGTPNSLIIDQNGASFGGAKVSFPRQEFRFLEESVPPGLFNVDAKNLSVEYVGADDQLKIQGQLTIKDPITKVLEKTEIVLDFTGQNFIGIQNGKVDVVGSASVKNLKLPGGWGLNELGISVDTTKKEIKGKTRINFPFPARSPIPPAFGGQQQSGRNFGLEVGFLLPPPNLRIDSANGDFDNLNIAIGTTGFFFQRIAGKVSNISKEDPIRFGGGVGFSYGPVVTVPIAQLAQDILGLPNSIDAAVVNLKLDVDSDFESSIAGSGELSIVAPQLFKIAGTAEYNWDKDFAKGNGSLNVIGGLISGKAQGRLDIDRGNFDGSGSVVVKIPDTKLFGFLKDKTFGSANAQIQYRDDSTTSNDFINAWGKINLGTINLPIVGEINLGLVDVGIRYYYLEGNVDLLGNKLPLIGSWNVAPDSEWVVMGADWDIANNDVKIRVIDPDGNIYQESEFADNGIAIVDDLTDSKTRTVVVGQPQAGIWDIEVVDDTGLGEVNYSAFGATDVPEVTLLTPDTDTTGVVDISFEAFDSDSDAKVSLFYDDDNAGFDGALITELTEIDGLSNFLWNTQGIATGEYFIYAMAMDDEGIPVFSNYSPGKVIVSEETDLSITQTASTNKVEVGGLLTYTIEVVNNGAVDTSNVVVTETLGEGTTLVNSSLAPSTQTNSEVIFDLGDLASGETKTFEFTVTAPIEGETLFSSAYVQGSVFDSNASNDASIVTTTIEPVTVELPNLVVTKEDDSSVVNLGDTFSYTLTVRNNGSGDATEVSLTEELPSGVNFVEVTASQGNAFQDFDGKIIADLDNIKSGEEATVTITVKPLAAGNLRSTTSVISNETDFNSLDNEIINTIIVNPTVPASADLELTQTVDNPNPNVGDQINFTLTLTNNGPGVASGIQVTDLLPSGLSFVSAFTLQGTYDSNTGIWDVGNLRDNLSRSLTITANVEDEGTIINNAEVTTVNEVDQDSNPGNNDPNEDDQASVTLNSNQSNNFTLILNNDNSFTITDNKPAKLSFQLLSNSKDSINEVGVFAVEDEQGTVNGLKPGDAGYVQAALSQSQARVILSALNNPPDGFNTDLSRIVEGFDGSDRLVFYLVQGSTTDQVLAGQASEEKVILGSSLGQGKPDSLRVEEQGNGEFTLFWEDQTSEGESDFNDMELSFQLTNDNPPIGTQLQGQTQRELIDLRGISGQVQANFTVNREAAFDNYAGLYIVDDEQGTVNGIAPGEAGYAQAALSQRIDNLELFVANQGTANFNNQTLDGGVILAPYLIVDSNVRDFLEQNPDNLPNQDSFAYFAYQEANPDSVDHIRLLADNTFGFEDKFGGGDQDYNDLIFQVNF
ncbi:MAG: DUF11 domain-containing protein [Symploca sp. SIO2B6]|nr:DUF11 domain-containing protein [Symploca sp. SIO2B6]